LIGAYEQTQKAPTKWNYPYNGLKIGHIVRCQIFI